VKIGQEEAPGQGPVLGIVTRQAQEARIDGVSGDIADELLQSAGIQIERPSVALYPLLGGRDARSMRIRLPGPIRSGTSLSHRPRPLRH
jgi:hypothetical protein